MTGRKRNADTELGGDSKRQAPKESPTDAIDAAGAAGTDGAKKKDKASEKREERKRRRAEENKLKPPKELPETFALLEGSGDVRKLASEYLRDWKHDRAGWRFQKVRQVYLLKHMYDPGVVDKVDFGILADYLEGLKGAARQATYDEAKAKVEVLEEETARDASEAESDAARDHSDGQDNSDKDAEKDADAEERRKQRAELDKQRLLRRIQLKRARKIMHALG